jgi:hypothetical protein
MPLQFTITKNGSNYSASVDGGAAFFVGKSTSYQGLKGLINLKNSGAIYSPSAYETQFGFWAYFIAPTAQAESGGSLTVLNTYDKAKFTFSFMQYAAHVPEGDFVKFFRKLLALPAATDYFPDLTLSNGRIAKRSGTTLQELESKTSTQLLMDYLNPTSAAIEDAEVINAAKFIHWAVNDADHRRIQIETAIAHFKSNMAGSYDKRYKLNGVPDYVCLVICDIRHQGRAKSDAIIAALNTGGDYEKALKNLLALGADKYKSRIDTLTAEITRLRASGKLGKRLWNSAAGDFA